MKAKGIVSNWAVDKLTPTQIEEETQALIKKFTAEYESVGSVPKNEVNFANTIQKLIDLDCSLTNEEGPLDFPQNVVTDKAIRDASVEAAKKLSQFEVEMAMKKDIFDNVVAFKENVGLEGLSPEQKRFVEKAIIAGRRNGLHLGEAERDKVKAVKKKISEIGTQFHSNLNEDTTFVAFTVEELAGVPKDLIDSFEKVDISLVSRIILLELIIFILG